MKTKLICLSSYHGVKERGKHSASDRDSAVDINRDRDAHTHACRYRTDAELLL